MPQTPVPSSSERLLYLVQDNALVAKDIAAQLEYFGYEVAIISVLSQLSALASWPQLREDGHQ